MFHWALQILQVSHEPRFQLRAGRDTSATRPQFGELAACQMLLVLHSIWGCEFPHSVVVFALVLWVVDEAPWWALGICRGQDFPVIGISSQARFRRIRSEQSNQPLTGVSRPTEATATGDKWPSAKARALMGLKRSPFVRLTIHIFPSQCSSLTLGSM